MESGKRIADLLQAKNGGNQSELARFVGVSPQAVQQWVAGETSPRGKNLNKVAEFFGIPPAQVLYGTSGGGATMRPRAEMEVAGLLQQAGWEVEVIGKDSADNLPAAFSGEGYRYIPDMRIRKAGRELYVEVSSWKFARHPAMVKMAQESGCLVLVDWDNPEEAIEKAEAILAKPPVPAVVRRDYLRFEVMDASAAAGAGVVNPDYPEVIGSIELDPNEAVAMLGTRQTNAVRLLNAHGDSMQPTINPRDLLFVDTRIDQFDQDGIYVFHYDGGTMVKRLQKVGGGRIAVKSDNPAYETFYIDTKAPGEQIHIIGKVLRAMPLQLKEFA